MWMNKLLIISVIFLLFHYKEPTVNNEFHNDILQIQFEDNVTFSQVLNFTFSENISVIKIKLMHFQYYQGFFRISENCINDFFITYDERYPIKSISYVLINDDRMNTGGGL